jgi:hypothetical protein
MELFSDVNIDEVTFSPDGKKVTLSFVDMHEGEPIGIIQCLSVLLFNYQNIFDDGEGFAAYVGEVTCSRIESKNISSFLSNMNFKFSGADGNVYTPNIQNLFALHVEGGEVILDIVCEVVEKDNVAII